jgi:hypothetical protein
VPYKVRQWLPLDPSTALSVSGGNPSWSSASALADALRCVGHSLGPHEYQLSK